MHVTLFLNHQCNLNCSYCYGGTKFDRSMPESIMKKGIEMAFESGPARISFFGGEPLLEFEKIQWAINYAETISREKNIPSPRYSLTVNGTLLNEDKLNYFADKGINPVISIDGCREAHEVTRPFANGASSYDAIISNLESARKKNSLLRTISVIDTSNVAYLSKSLEALLALRLTKIRFSMNYESTWTEDDLKVLETQLEKVSQRYVDLYRQGRPVSINLIDSKIVTHLKEGYSCADRCKFGAGEITVAPSGRLYPCERLVGEDNNNDVTIGDIDHGVDLARVLQMATAKNTPDKECANCALADRCMFWCGCVNYATTKNVGQTSGILCRLEQLQIAAADAAGSTLFVERNPAFIQKFYPAVLSVN